MTRRPRYLLRVMAIITVGATLGTIAVPPVHSQALSNTTRQLGAITLNSEPTAPTARAQSYPSSAIPTDVTPFNVVRESGLFSPYLRFKLFQHLPARFWLSATTEASQRLETNVFQTDHKKRQDYVFRIVPNVTTGYNLTDTTAVYCNFFVIKDNFAKHQPALGPPTTMSLSMGARQDWAPFRKTSVQFDFQVRELWQAPHIHQADLIPAINVTQIVTPSIFLFGSALLQMRSRELFGGAQREIDPFYSVGVVYRRGQWNFVLSDTYVTNFRNETALPPQGNVTMVADFEVFRPISSKLPGMVAFMRAEPIWNWHAHGIPGQCGFDYRFYSGVRMTLNKPAYNASINRLRQQLKDIQELQKKKKQQQQPGSTEPAKQEPSAQPGSAGGSPAPPP